jgi:protein-serine/threonine kinase
MSTLNNNKAIEPDEVASLTAILKNTAYKAVSKISYGSYGEIFKIRDSQREYAMKVVSKSRMAKEHKLHESVIEGFVLRKLDHPGIIKYFETIEVGDYICHIEEYCPFGDLFGVMKKVNKSMDLVTKRKEIAKYYLAQVLSAMVYLHQQGLIHRDIKLENIVINDDLKAKLVDFGTAKSLKMENFYTEKQVEFIGEMRNFQLDTEEDESPRISLVGSANYLSPESISLNYSYASDVWAYGVLAFKMVHGKLPFEGKDNIEIFKKIKEHSVSINEKV